MLKFIRIILSPLTILYKFIINLRNSFFYKNTFKQTKVNAKVVSVGNLTVGGSGKTPFVIMLTKYLKSKKNRVGVLSRGYGRNSKGYHLVSKGDSPLIDVSKSGDEILLVSAECKVPAAVSEKRVIGAQNFLNDVELDTIVLDDAFQHRWIWRDLNILIIDQKFLSNVNSIDQNLLPLGSMREPFESTKRADLIVINRKFSPKITLPSKLKHYFLEKSLYYSYYSVEGIYDVKDNKKYTTKDFEGQHSLVVCGIAKPFSFLRVLEENNINIKNKIIFNDHKNYTIKEVEEIRKKFYSTNSYSVLTTQKDAVKLMQFRKELDDIDIYFLKIELQIEDDKKFFEEIDAKILN
ncbi:MAG: tetraacyldisaccharide 4'-kinase [Ignavibacteriales bacterium]|nr:tetraacyldisaccharide 4'-kinase [Ignavibacteriales bacterium]